MDRVDYLGAVHNITYFYYINMRMTNGGGNCPYRHQTVTGDLLWYSVITHFYMFELC